MNFHGMPGLAALVLIQGLAACSSAPGPAPQIAVQTGPQSAPRIAAADQESRLPAEPVTVKPAPSPRDQDPAGEAAATPREAALAFAGGETPLPVPANAGPLDQRFLRPVLALGEETALPLPDLLPEGAAVSYVVIDLERGLPIAERGSARAHIPASSAKIATAVAALRLLGPEHRFRTELRITGPIEEGVLKGDLILKGGGDPLLDIPDVLPLIEALTAQRIRGIEGRFLIDDASLPRFTEIEPAQPTDAAYNPGVGALSLAFNRVKLRWSRPGGLDVETVPHLDEAAFEPALAEALPPGGVGLKRLDGGRATWQLADKGRRRSSGSLPVKDPGLHAGRVFVELARLHGIDLPSPERAVAPAPSRLLAVRESRPLRELARDMLWYSNNLMAELIGLSAAKRLAPELSRLDEAAGLLLADLERQLPAVSWNGARLDNHSGLSSRSRLSPAQLAAILHLGWQDGMVSSLLPGSGWSGTLARRFDGPDQALRVWAKTGSINYVATLGGYLLSATHSPAAFVIMISDERARAAYDAEPRRTRASEARADRWQKDAGRALNQIVERWLDPAAPGLLALDDTSR